MTIGALLFIFGATLFILSAYLPPSAYTSAFPIFGWLFCVWGAIILFLVGLNEITRKPQ